MPNLSSNFRQAMPEAPAPVVTIFTSLISFPTISSALSNAAPTIIAVPCWSSWKMGIFIRLRNFPSTSKHSGDFISSRLMPPNVGSRLAIMSTSFSGSFSFISISNTSIPANVLNKTPLPSITGFDARGPISPKPNTAVPLLMTATRLERAVISATAFGSDTMAWQGSATPGL